MHAGYVMTPYDEALAEILEHGVTRTNKRTGIKTRSIFGMQKRYRIDDHFPIVTRRKVWPKAIFAELLWFLSGSTNNKDLQALGSNIWTPWVDPEFEKKHGYAEGSLGPVYGFQLRHFNGEYGDGSGNRCQLPNHIGDVSNFNEWLHSVKGTPYYGFGGFDQLAYMMERIKEDPSDRRIMFSLWNPNQLAGMKLPPCHFTYQILIDDDRRMTGILTQRSGDYFVGCCANIQFYSALTYMFAQQTGCNPYELVHNVNDAHIYENQVDGVKEYLDTPIIDSPRLELKKATDIQSYCLDDFVLHNFSSGPRIKVPVAI